jgi:hypothetical protein
VALGRSLERVERLRQPDQEGEPQAWCVAHGLTDIAGSLKKIGELLPRLQAAQTEPELEDLLLDVGEELRHIRYHIYDMEYFRYIRPDAEE